MTTPAPPLTEAELAELERLLAHPFNVRLSEADSDEYGSYARFDALNSWWSRENRQARIEAQLKRSLALESELAQLRQEKAEREELERRTVALLDDGWSLYLGRGEDGTCEVILESVSVRHLGTGPTYEAALAAALEKVEKS